MCLAKPMRLRFGGVAGLANETIRVVAMELEVHLLRLCFDSDKTFALQAKSRRNRATEDDCVAQGVCRGLFPRVRYGHGNKQR